ncbi:hypothetical protein ACTNBM_12030 [Lachnospiraceae bacterium HCP1S3_C3]
MTMYDGKEMYEGLLFMRSFKSEENLMPDVTLDMLAARKAGIIIKNVLVDDNYSKSVDREEMTDLLGFLNKVDAKVLVVEDIHDITDDANDLRKMMDRINGMDIIIFELRSMSARFNNYNHEC